MKVVISKELKADHTWGAPRGAVRVLVVETDGSV